MKRRDRKARDAINARCAPKPYSPDEPVACPKCGVTFRSADAQVPGDLITASTCIARSTDKCGMRRSKKLPEPANPALGRSDGTKRPLYVQDLVNVETYEIEVG